MTPDKMNNHSLNIRDHRRRIPRQSDRIMGYSVHITYLPKVFYIEQARLWTKSDNQGFYTDYNLPTIIESSKRQPN